MGQKIVLTETFTDTSLPILYDDPALTPGSLALLDMTHSLGTSGAGVPANNAAIPNIAYNQAKTLIGSGDATTLAFKFINTFVAPKGGFERTSAGSLYGVVSRTDQGGLEARIELADLIKTYLTANPARAMAFFIWADVKRLPTSNSNMRETGIVNTSAAATNFLLNGQLVNSLGVQRTEYGVATGWTGSPNATPAANSAVVCAWGNTPSYNPLNANDGRSFILQRLHLVDVAASGKTFAQLSADDAALYTTLHGAGGRFNGETTTLNLGDYP